MIVTPTTDLQIFEYKKLVKEGFKALLDDVIAKAATGCAFDNVKPNTKIMNLTVFTFLRIVVPKGVTEETLLQLLSGGSEEFDSITLFDRMIDAVIVTPEDINPVVYKILKYG